MAIKLLLAFLEKLSICLSYLNLMPKVIPKISLAEELLNVTITILIFASCCVLKKSEICHDLHLVLNKACRFLSNIS